MRKTANGSPAHKTSGSACLDLFSFIGAARLHPTQAVQGFERAFKQDPSLALRILLWARDARGGAGERTTFRNILHWLERKHPDLALRLVTSGIIPMLGRWDDLLCVSTQPLWVAVAHQVAVGLASGDRLAAKWMPRRGPVAARLCQILGVPQSAWRKQLVALSDTVEQKMSAGEWSDINYSGVPSVAASRYQSTFARNDAERYTEFLTDVTEGRATMNAGVAFPHDVLKASRHNDVAATAQWSQLPRLTLVGQALVLADVSGSMEILVSGSTSAMDVSVALGLLLSESLPAPFKNKVLTFSSNPKLHEVTGDTLAERAGCLMSAEWGMTTNIQAAFRLVLQTAIDAADPGFVMPKALIVLSDMQFDKADKCGLTNHAAMTREFERAGFAVPTLVYWNLNGSGDSLPACAQVPGALFVSGFSPKIAEVVLSGEFDKLTPDALMRAAVEVPRYDVLGATVAIGC